eukprot:IDg7986t1
MALQQLFEAVRNGEVLKTPLRDDWSACNVCSVHLILKGPGRNCTAKFRLSLTEQTWDCLHFDKNWKLPIQALTLSIACFPAMIANKSALVELIYGRYCYGWHCDGCGFGATTVHSQNNGYFHPLQTVPILNSY